MSLPVIRSILVASDLSPESDVVVQGAATLAEHLGAQLHCLHAVHLVGRALSSAPLDLIRLEGLVQEARTRLDDQLARLLPPEVTAEVSIDYRAAAAAILEKAREVSADLIVMGPHASRVPGSRLMGSTAERVVAKAEVPCMVVRQPVQPPLRRVLFPVSGPDIEMGLLGHGTGWLCGMHQGARRAPTPSTELWALHVIESPSAWREISTKFAEEVRGVGIESPVRLRRRLAWSRNPAEEILRAAEEGRVDLIAVGVRGQGALMRALLGSVSSAVLHRTDRSVLLFPPRLCDRWARTIDATALGLADPLPVA